VPAQRDGGCNAEDAVPYDEVKHKKGAKGNGLVQSSKDPAAMRTLRWSGDLAIPVSTLSRLDYIRNADAKTLRHSPARPLGPSAPRTLLRRSAE
jgi:hypothetical protein